MTHEEHDRARTALEALATSKDEPRIFVGCDELADLFRGKGYDVRLRTLIARPGGTITFVPIDAVVEVARRLCFECAPRERRDK